MVERFLSDMILGGIRASCSLFFFDFLVVEGVTFFFFSSSSWIGALVPLTGAFDHRMFVSYYEGCTSIDDTMLSVSFSFSLYVLCFLLWAIVVKHDLCL